MHWAVSIWLSIWEHNRVDIPSLHHLECSAFSGVSIMQEAFLSILSKLDATQECTGYIAYKTYFVLYVMVSSALGTEVIIAGVTISFKFHYRTPQTTNAQESPGIRTTQGRVKNPAMPARHCPRPPPFPCPCISNNSYDVLPQSL